MHTTQTLKNIITMKVRQEDIDLFLKVIGDKNPVHRDVSSANNLVKLTGRQARDKIIVPGLYFASKIARMLSPYNSLEFKFKDFIYPEVELELVKEFSYDGIEASCYEDGSLKLEAIARSNPGNELKLNGSFKHERIIREEDVRNFNKCLNDYEGTNGGVPSELLGSLISAALWKYLEQNKKEGYGLYSRQGWNFYRPVAINQPIIVKIEQKREKKNLYLFNTSIETDGKVAVSGEAGCILIPK